MPQVKIKEGFSHRVLPEDYDPKALPKGAPGPLAYAGDVIEVSDDELESFGDKFEVLGSQPKPKRRGRPRKAKPEPEPEAEAKAPED